MNMSVLLMGADEVEIPTWVTDLPTFRRWVHSPAVPDDLKVFWIGGKVWVDMRNEQIFSHVDVKGEMFRVLANLVRDLDIGRVFADGALYTNDDADIGVNPDAMFISHAARAEGRVTFVEGREGGHVEIRGTPDMVLEVVSRSSVTKDTKRLFEAYWVAGVPEYWLVDARKSPPRFEVYRRTGDGYVGVRRRDGWLRSPVFGRQLRFVESKDRFGDPAYSLQMQ
jgi:Uma2 family endonuclease